MFDVPRNLSADLFSFYADGYQICPKPVMPSSGRNQETQYKIRALQLVFV